MLVHNNFQAKAPGNGEPARDLGMAQAAFDLRDMEASKAVHSVNALVPKNNETHPRMGGYIKSIMYGGLDGIISIFAVVAGAAGAGYGPNVVIVLGVSTLIADALSMGVGDAMSSKAEAEVAMRERDREKWELENFKEGEIREMVEIYKGKGMAEEDAELVMRVCAKYEDLFVDMMLVDELGINPPDDDDSWTPHVKEGLVAFSSFCVFGFVPIAAYCIVGTASEDVDSLSLFIISCVMTGVTLFFLGGVLRPRAAPSPRHPSAPLRPAAAHTTFPPLPCGRPASDHPPTCDLPSADPPPLRLRPLSAFKSTVTTRSWRISGLEVLAVGSLVALVAFGIGLAIDVFALS